MVIIPNTACGKYVLVTANMAPKERKLSRSGCLSQTGISVSNYRFAGGQVSTVPWAYTQSLLYHL
jgi:hypothetical protein